jgi:hypothetical protein
MSDCLAAGKCSVGIQRAVGLVNLEERAHAKSQRRKGRTEKEKNEGQKNVPIQAARNADSAIFLPQIFLPLVFFSFPLRLCDFA